MVWCSFVSGSSGDGRCERAPMTAATCDTDPVPPTPDRGGDSGVPISVIDCCGISGSHGRR